MGLSTLVDEVTWEEEVDGPDGEAVEVVLLADNEVLIEDDVILSWRYSKNSASRSAVVLVACVVDGRVTAGAVVQAIPYGRSSSS